MPCYISPCPWWIEQRRTTAPSKAGWTSRHLTNNLFGEWSVDHPFTEPWENLLTPSTPSVNLANGFRYAWSQSTTTFQEVTTQEQLIDETLLLTQDIARAGFYIGGTVSPSVTNAITIKLERAQALQLGWQIYTSLGRDAHENGHGKHAVNKVNFPTLSSRSLWIHGGYNLPGCICNILGTSLSSDSAISGMILWKARSSSRHLWSKPGRGGTIRPRPQCPT